MEGFYFAPNNGSFRLTKRNESIKYKMGGFYFASNNDSFRLTKTNSSIKKEILDATQVDPVRSREGSQRASASNGVEELANNVKDINKHKRDFLKIAGVAGLGLAGTVLFPKKADALILGGTPTSSVVGVKNIANTRINPATEGTLDEVLKTTDLALDVGVLQVKVTAVSGAGSSSFSDSGDVAKSGLVDAARHVQVDVLSSALPATASTETTLETIAFGGKKYALRLATDSVNSAIDYVGEADIGTVTSADDWRIKRINSTTGIIIMWAGTTANNAGGFDYVWDNGAGVNYEDLEYF